MFKNYLKIALRNILRHKGFATINITGLAIGITCCILIMLWVQGELSYDKHHEHAERIYRVVGDFHSETGTHDFARTAPLLAPTLKRELPEIEQAVRFKRYSAAVRHGDKQFQERFFYMVEPGIVDMLTIPFIAGDPKNALTAPHTIVLTESMSKKYFGEDESLGKTLTVADSMRFTVTGIIEDLPSTTHFNFDFLASFATWEKIIPERWLNTWANNIYYTYIMLKPGATRASVENKLPAFADKHINTDENGLRETLLLQPLTDIHLYSNRRQEMQANGNATYVYIFSIVALIVLMIACVNFMNLATARSIHRGKEIGLRKVVGAMRANLVKQFLGEAVLMSLFASLLAVLLVDLILPYFNLSSGKQLTFNPFVNPEYAFILLGFSVLIGLFSGSYPALLLSRFQPAAIFKGAMKSDNKGILLRKGLVILQFAISIILIVGAVVVSQQLDYMRNRNLGFDKEQILIIPFLWDSQVQEHYQTLKTEMLQQPGVLAVTASGDTPGRMATTLSFHAEGMPENEYGGITALIVDPDFVETYGIDVLAGRDFSNTITSDPDRAVVINEKAVYEIGWASPEEAVGKKLLLQNMEDSYIIGVVRDFHVNSLHQPVDPLAMAVWPSWFGYISAKVTTDNLSEVVRNIEHTWNAVIPNRPFTYYFLDEDFNRQYRAEEKFQTLFVWFSSLAIFIACLGLFGLASFAAEQRLKEIGIRKVLGASVSNIVLLLTKDISRLILIATLLAWPTAYFIMRGWLQNFAYRITFDPLVLIGAGLVALSIAILTVSYQSIKAALTDAVDTLRYE